MKTVKQTIILLAILVLVLGLIPLVTQAASTNVLIFTLNSDGQSYSVTDCSTSASGALTIPATYNGKPVTSIGRSAFSGCKYLTSVIIPDSVTYIDYGAFKNCSSLTAITIPDSVTVIGNAVFGYCSSLKSVSIGNGVTKIGENAFFGCTGLTSVNITDIASWCGISFDSTPSNYAMYVNGELLEDLVIPDSVTRIGRSAFSGCDSVTSVTIPDSVTSIGGSAFSGCDSLTAVTIGDGVTSIGSYAFYSCDSLTSITIPDSVTSIGESAFESSGLTSITIPDSVTSIGESAFYNCLIQKIVIAEGSRIVTSGMIVCEDTLKEITIPDSVTSIGNYAFYDCDSLTSVTIPDSVTSIGDKAFYDCDSLTGIWVDEENPAYCSDEYGGLYNKDKTTLIQVPGGISGAYTISDSTTSIGESAFSGCAKLTSITIPDSVTSIGNSAFYSCNSLTSITIPDSVTSIGNSAFYDCDSITSITIPDSVTSIGNSAFYSCNSLTSITIPDSVTSIGDWTFQYCTRLTAVTIPDSVTSIGDYAFRYCHSLADVYYDGLRTQWNAITIGSDNESLKNAKLHLHTELPLIFELNADGKSYSVTDCCQCAVGNLVIPAVYKGHPVTSIGNSAFYDCDSITSITIPDSVTSIGKSAFSSCAKLTSITIPDSVTSIGEYAFSWCTSLTSITIPDSVTSIGESAFDSCDSLTGIWVDAKNTAYCSDAAGVLYNKDKTTLIQAPRGITGAYTIPASVTAIPDSAFYNCDSLTSITIPDSVTSIGKSAFESSGLTSITIPDSVIIIGKSAFYNCTGLTAVTIGDGVTSIGNSAFGYCKSLTSVTMGSSVTIIDGAAFKECSSLISVTMGSSVTIIGNSVFKYCNMLTHIYYDGTQAQWNAITIGSDNTPLRQATLHCNIFLEKEDGTLQLCDDTTIEELTVMLDQTIDLNGYVLTVDSLASFGQIIDSVGGGGLIANNIEISGNDWLPILDSTGCYRFYEHEAVSLGSKKSANGAVFGFTLDFADSTAYDMLAASEDVQITVTLAVGESVQTYAFCRELVAKYVALMKTYPALRPCMKLTVTGIDGLEEGTVLAVIPSITAVGGKLQMIGESMQTIA